MSIDDFASDLLGKALHSAKRREIHGFVIQWRDRAVERMHSGIKEKDLPLYDLF